MNDPRFPHLRRGAPPTRAAAGQMLRDAGRALADAQRAQSELNQARAEDPNIYGTTNQFGGLITFAPTFATPAQVAEPADLLIRWDQCGADVDIPEGGTEQVLASITFRERGVVAWARFGTITAAHLPFLRVKFELLSAARSITINGNGGADFIEAPALVGPDGGILLPMFVPVFETDRIVVTAINQQPSTTTAIQAFGCFGFRRQQAA